MNALRSVAATAACAALLCGCASIPGLSRVRQLIDRPASVVEPHVETQPTSDLPPPASVRASSGELRAVPLKWEPLLVSDVDGYVVERASAREGPFDRVAVVAGRLATIWVDEDAIPDAIAPADGEAPTPDGATWHYRVRSFDSAGRLSTDASEIATGTTARPPEPPGSLRAYSHQPREVPLSWRASESEHVVGYLLERSPTSVGPFESLVELSGRHATVFVDRNLGDLRVFYYRVSARNAAGGNGEPTEPVRAVTKPEPLPPVGLRVEQQGLGVNGLVWEPNVEPDIVRYQLLRTREAGDAPEVVDTVTSDQTRAYDRAVGAGEKVRYTVIAFDRDGLESGASVPAEVDSVGYGLTATARPDGIYLKWNGRAEEGFSGARIFRGGLFNQRELPAVSGEEAVDRDVEPGGSYRYAVVLERPDGTRGPRSAMVEIRIPSP